MTGDTAQAVKGLMERWDQVAETAEEREVEGVGTLAFDGTKWLDFVASLTPEDFLSLSDFYEETPHWMQP